MAKEGVLPLFFPVTKPLDPLGIKSYLWKDDVDIFNLAPWDLKSPHLLAHNGPLKIIPTEGNGQKCVMRPYPLACPL